MPEAEEWEGEGREDGELMFNGTKFYLKKFGRWMMVEFAQQCECP